MDTPSCWVERPGTFKQTEFPASPPGLWLCFRRQRWPFERPQRRKHLEAQLDQLLTLKWCLSSVRYHLSVRILSPHWPSHVVKSIIQTLEGRYPDPLVTRSFPSPLPAEAITSQVGVVQPDLIMVGRDEACSLFLAPQVIAYSSNHSVAEHFIVQGSAFFALICC
jgi:hypothetical protein